MKNIWEFLNGKKTAIAAVINAILPWAIGQGWIDTATAGMIGGVLAAIGISHKAVKSKK